MTVQSCDAQKGYVTDFTKIQAIYHRVCVLKHQAKDTLCQGLLMFNNEHYLGQVKLAPDIPFTLI